MAGLGSRFAGSRYTVPKPLIPVDGRPMFLEALSGLAGLSVPWNLSVVIRSQLQRDHNLADTIRTHCPDANIIELEEMTGGALETCMAARNALAPDDIVTTLDCDLFFRCPALLETLEGMAHGAIECAGVLTYFKADSPRYSYLETDKAGLVCRTVEKEVISDKAMAGVYTFGSAKIFLNVGDKALSGNVGTLGEYYIAPVFNDVIATFGEVLALPLEEYASFGTPGELRKAKGARSA